MRTKKIKSSTRSKISHIETMSPKTFQNILKQLSHIKASFERMNQDLSAFTTLAAPKRRRRTAAQMAEASTQ